MPSLLTHNFFALDILDSIGEGSCIKNYPSCFSLGAQGPDPLFFSCLLFNKSFSIKAIKGRYGSKLHKLDGTQLFKEMFNQYNKIEDSQHKEVFLAFIMGQLTHYVLDSTCHPYVYYFTGFDKNSKLSGKLHYSHAHFEARIDSSLANFKNKKELTYKPSKVLQINDDLLKIINDNFNAVIEKVLDVKVNKNYYSSGVKNMIKIYNFVNCGKGGFGKFLGKNVLGQLYIPRSQDKTCLNEQHFEWKIPYSGVTCKDSFLELYKKAFTKYISCFNLTIKNGINYQSISGIFNGLNYSGYPINQVMKYQDLQGILLDFKLKRK